MDESAFPRVRDKVTAPPCVFEKALLARCCACPLAEIRSVAERDSVACASPPAREQCAALGELLRLNSAFALKLAPGGAPLTHAKDMKLQCGGLLGVQQAVASADTAKAPPFAARGIPRVADVHSLVQIADAKFVGLHNLPYSAIVRSVAAYPIRRRQGMR